MSAYRKPQAGNLSPTERWLSMLAGTGFAVSALSRGGLISRLVGAAAAASLLSRGATGYCGMKATMDGTTSLRDGIREQLQRASDQLRGSTTRQIEDMETLYGMELQELHSAESQLASLLSTLTGAIRNSALAVRLDAYAAELRGRETDLENLLTAYRLSPDQHPDDAMRALLKEAEKMAQLRVSVLRDAALAASIQRIIHYKIAGYGTIAAYAKALDRFDEAARFADLADRDKAIDAALTDLAKNALNPDASREAIKAPPEEPPVLRPH